MDKQHKQHELLLLLLFKLYISYTDYTYNISIFTNIKKFLQYIDKHKQYELRTTTTTTTQTINSYVYRLYKQYINIYEYQNIFKIYW
jgi:hypothetical protein